MLRRSSYAMCGTGWAGDGPRGLISPGSPRSAAGLAGHLGLVDHEPAGWFGHGRCTPGLPALGPSSSDRTNSDGNSKQDKTPQGLNSVYSKANRFARLRFELQLTSVQNPNFFILFQARSSRSGLVQLRKPQCSLRGEQFCCKRGETQVSSLLEAIQVWINNPAVSY